MPILEMSNPRPTEDQEFGKVVLKAYTEIGEC